MPMPHAVLDRLGNPSIIVGFDCETHDWCDDAKRKGRIGPFGWYTVNDDVPLARIVQLGWAVGDASVDAEIVVKSALIQPRGFEIAEKAIAHHHITQDIALEHGRPLASVLEEFMRDVSQACSRGVRVCAHQLEFDAGVIDQELQRCGLESLRLEWARLARCGYCTMNPEAGRWLLQCAGQETGLETTKHILGLVRTMGLLGLRRDASSQGRDAASDAKMTRLVYATLLQRAVANSAH